MENSLFFNGCLVVSIQGQNIERFFNIAAQRGVQIQDIVEHDGCVTFCTTPKNFRCMKGIARKSNVKLRICSRRGVPFLIYQNRKRKLMAVGLLFFGLFLYGMSFFIWDITFEGNRKFTDEVLLHYLQTIPIVHGMRKKEIFDELIESEIRNQFPEITWVSVEVKGTRLLIHIKENEGLLAVMDEDITPCDLFAEKQGMIVRTVVRNGFCLIKEGEMVEPGTLLVDGSVPIYDDAGTMINCHEVHADAEIFAETEHRIQKYLPLTILMKNRTGEIRSGGYVQIMDRTFYLMPPSNEQENWEYVSEQRQLKLFDNFYLPVYFGKIMAYETVSYEKNYTEEEVEGISRAYLQEYMEKLQEKGIQILGSDGKIEKGESGWQITGTLKVIENIAIEVPGASEEQMVLRGDYVSK